MRSSRSSWLALGIPAVIVVIATAVVVIPPMALVVGMHRQVEQTRRALLERSDYPDLLAACRQMMAAIPEAQPVFVEIKDRRVPDAIRNLKAQWIAVTKDQVRLEFGGGAGLRVISGVPAGITRACKHAPYGRDPTLSATAAVDSFGISYGRGWL